MKNKKQLIAQSKRLIEGRYNFTLWELRLYLKMVEMIEKEDGDFKEYRIYFKDLIKEYGGKGKYEYKVIYTSAKRLLKKLVKIKYVDEKGYNRFVETHLLSAVDYPEDWRDKDDNSYLELSFDPHLRPYLLDLKGNFLLYDRRNILLLQSKFSVRIYQLLKSHERKSKDSIVVEYSIKVLREMLLVDDEGNPTKEYSKYYMFKKRVLLQAQKELQEHTDIAFSFDEIKKGRRVDMIRFYVRKNRNIKSKETPIKTAKELPLFDTVQSETLWELDNAGIKPDKAISLINMLGEDVALKELKNAQKALKNSYNIKNEAGFIVRMMEEQSYTKSQAIKEEQQQEKKKKAEEAKALTEMHKQQIKELREEYRIERNKAVSILLKDLDKGQVAELVDEYAKKKPHIQTAIKKAEEQKNTEEANDFKFGLFVKDLKDESLHTFEKYIKATHGLKLKYVGNEQHLYSKD